MPSDRRTEPSTSRRHGKRALDLVLGAVAAILAIPVMAVAAIAVRSTMGPPVLFRQERAGLGGRPFRLLKFRTMRPARPDEQGPESDDARTTSVGRFLRRTSLDELPSLLNVIVGHMSLVGPRPLPTAYLPRYSPTQARRHEVRPGLTGLAQVEGRNLLSWDERLALDVRYVDEWSLGLDLRILWRTVGVVLRGTGVDHAEGVTMTEFTGPGS